MQATVLNTGSHANGGTTVATPSITPSATARHFAVVYGLNDGPARDVSSVTGNGLTFTRVAGGSLGGSNAGFTCEIWQAVPGSPSAGAWTATLDGDIENVRIVAIDVEGCSNVLSADKDRLVAINVRLFLPPFGDPANRPLLAAVAWEGGGFTPVLADEAGFVDLDNPAGVTDTQLSGAIDYLASWNPTSPDNDVNVGWGDVGVEIGAVAIELVQRLHLAEATLQGVATMSPTPNGNSVGDATLQGVATFAPDGFKQNHGALTMQGVGRVTAEADAVPRLDFTTYDAYLEGDGDVRGLVFYDEQKPETVSRKLEPTRTDVGNNPDEIRPDFGNFFAQSDFSHGAGQTYFHQPGRDPKKAFYIEGFDISDPGRLTHLRAIAEAVNSASVGAVTQVGDVPIVAVGTDVQVGNGAFPGSWSTEDPSGADGNVTVNDLIAEGARAFAALATATAGVRVRSSGGAWSRFQVSGTDLDVGTPTRLAWLKSRLMVIGGTTGRSIYEVAATATPTAIETLPEGWAFEHIFEAGGFIHACAVNPSAGLSRVHHYGLNAAGSAIEKKSSTPWPQGQLMYVGVGFPGLAFIAGGKRNSSGGYDPILYRATIDRTFGELDYVEIREEEGSGSADLSVRAMTTLGETVLAGWSLGSGAFGGARDGLAIYHVDRDAFALHLRKTGGGSSQRIRSIMPYKGRVLLSILGDGLYYEDLTAYVPTATLVTSLADWNNAGQKVWDLVEVSHDALAASTSFLVEYDTVAQELATFDPVIKSDVLGAEGASGRLSNIKARVFALRVTSTATASASPAFRGYSVRSLPSPTLPEFQLTRYVRLLSRDQKDSDGEVISQNPREVLAFLQDALFSFVKFYESGTSWTAWLEDVSTVEPEQPFYETTGGEALRDAFVVRLQLTGTR